MMTKGIGQLTGMSNIRKGSKTIGPLLMVGHNRCVSELSGGPTVIQRARATSESPPTPYAKIFESKGSGDTNDPRRESWDFRDLSVPSRDRRMAEELDSSVVHDNEATTSMHANEGNSQELLEGTQSNAWNLLTPTSRRGKFET